MLKKSQGNMYDWVTHMHSHLGGECPHRCSYCYVQTGMARLSGCYKGDLRLIDNEFGVNYGKGKIIFIEHMNDMFAKEIPEEWVKKILFHCSDWLDNQYVFQTKNPARAYGFIDRFPKNFMIGTTIETNRVTDISFAPTPYFRFEGIKRFSLEGFKTFITIEPILDFDLLVLLEWIRRAKPSFVNIGADSKGCGLTEPSKEKVLALIAGLQESNITIKKKVNLRRLGIDLEQ